MRCSLDSVEKNIRRLLKGICMAVLKSIDLFLGSDIGYWALDHLDLSKVMNVFTIDDQIYLHAESLGLSVSMKNANLVEFIPSNIGFSIHYPRIIKPHLISQYKKLYNIHPGYLPWGRGYYPIFWALFEQTPCGITIHEITEGVDEGPIVMQREVEYFSYDTGDSLYRRVARLKE